MTPSSQSKEELTALAGVRKVLAPFYKAVDVMKAARNSPTHTMNVWADDMKAAEDVASLLALLSNGTGEADSDQCAGTGRGGQ